MAVNVFWKYMYTAKKTVSTSLRFRYKLIPIIDCIPVDIYKTLV